MEGHDPELGPIDVLVIGYPPGSLPTRVRRREGAIIGG